MSDRERITYDMHTRKIDILMISEVHNNTNSAETHGEYTFHFSTKITEEQKKIASEKKGGSQKERNQKKEENKQENKEHDRRSEASLPEEERNKEKEEANEAKPARCRKTWDGSGT